MANTYSIFGTLLDSLGNAVPGGTGTVQWATMPVFIPDAQGYLNPVQTNLKTFTADQQGKYIIVLPTGSSIVPASTNVIITLTPSNEIYVGSVPNQPGGSSTLYNLTLNNGWTMAYGNQANTVVTTIQSTPNLSAQQQFSVALQSAAVANGNGVVAGIGGYNGSVQVDVQITGTGTGTLNFESSMDNVVWYAMGWAQLDAQGSGLTRSSSALALSGAANHVYKILDNCNYFRARLSSMSGTSLVVNATLYAVPV